MSPSMPWWIRAYLLFGAAQAFIIGLTGLVAPAGIQVPVPISPLNARFTAALYLAAGIGLTLAALAEHRADARLFVLGFTFATGLIMLVTALRWSQFMADGLPHRLSWLASYTLDPLLGAMTIAAGRLLPLPPPAHHRLTPLLLVAAAVFGALGLFLLFFPDLAPLIWPWAMTPLLAQLYSCFILTFALGSLLAAREDRPAAVRSVVLSLLALMLFVLAASLHHLDRFRPGPSSWVWFATLAIGAGVFGAALVGPARRLAPTLGEDRP
jgi:hypothetical protein